MLIRFFLAALTALEPAPAASASESDDPVRLWMNSNRSFKPGEAVKVQVETGRAGYLLVLHYAPDGRLSVLFPLDPQDDAFVEAGRRYEMRDDRGEASFFAGGPGPGFVYSAISEDPWRLDDVRTPNGWDYGKLSISKDARNPEADITALLEPLATERGYDYDALDYYVVGGGRPHYASTTYVYADDYYSDCYDCWGPSAIYIGLGWPYGYGWPWWYSRYSYRYRYWGFPYYPYYPYRPYYPYYRYRTYPYKTVVGRPRGYTIENRVPYSGRTRSGTVTQPSSRPGEVSGENRGSGRARGRRPEATRPTNDRNDGAAKPSNSGTSRPRSEPSRPRGSRDNSQSRVVSPQIERARPAARARGNEWVRTGDAPEAARSSSARRVQSAPVYVERSRGSRGSNDRVERVERMDVARPVRESPRGAISGARRSEPVSRPADRGNDSRAVTRPRESGSGNRFTQPRSGDRPAPAVRSSGSQGGGRVSAPPPSRSAPVQRSSGGSSGRSQPSSGQGGGSSRSRGGRP